MTARFKEIISSGSTPLLFILCLVASGGVGFLLGQQVPESASVRPEIKVGEIELNALPAASYAAAQQEDLATEEGSSEGSEIVVASKSGSKYHYPWCAGAKQMKEENKIFFSSSAEARAAGYEPAANCKGLE